MAWKWGAWRMVSLGSWFWSSRRPTMCRNMVLTNRLCHAVSVMTPSDYAGGLVKDLSMGGCRIALAKTPKWIRPGSAVHLEFELPGVGHVTNLAGVVKNAEGGDGGGCIGLEFQFNKLEYIEYRGWGGSVRSAIEQWTAQQFADVFPIR